MGRQKRDRALRDAARAANRPLRETHEPEEPLPGWPTSHATSQLTDMDQTECVKVTIHGVDHYVHATTARALWESLGGNLEDYNKIATEAGFPPV